MGFDASVRRDGARTPTVIVQHVGLAQVPAILHRHHGLFEQVFVTDPSVGGRT